MSLAVYNAELHKHAHKNKIEVSSQLWVSCAVIKTQESLLVVILHEEISVLFIDWRKATSHAELSLVEHRHILPNLNNTSILKISHDNNNDFDTLTLDMTVVEVEDPRSHTVLQVAIIQLLNQTLVEKSNLIKNAHLWSEYTNQ